MFGMRTYPAKECMVFWTPNNDFYFDEQKGLSHHYAAMRGKVTVKKVPVSDEYYYNGPHMMVQGACDLYWREASDIELRLCLLCLFNTMVLRDRIDPWVAHKALLKIDEYRNECISRDTSGAPYEAYVPFPDDQKSN